MTRTVRAVPPPDHDDILPGSTFCDAYAMDVPGERGSARAAAMAVFGTMPVWVRWLMAARNLLVTPFGLKTEPHPARDGADRIGFFPVVAERPERIVLGFDDRHLDFRIITDIVPVTGDMRRIRVATAVRTCNRLGRTYLALILPFHRMIVRAAMARARF